ncbi:hypothetical protein [Wenzhouxiangella marina]|uniref:Uncharacterized protein n=1 Tax=Wenzhouxiangella marina TaxID=1579979 RepID=A0A0K0XUR2_9GAMM|nr:hypothetical protein [Wenzhouxiangella marina]AKS41356.1 hypothetical protein WM2015_977 [Wenzhouxiangella marina]MBB6086892.1 hypothetical protein [Wenzhouxiangella marina]
MHHIRLVASFEIRGEAPQHRQLERGDCERLASALAEDLARDRQLPEEALLVVGGALFEPAELLQPGMPTWQALEDLSRNVARDPGRGGQILAIGAHQGRMPDQGLTPPAAPPQGQLLALPILLSVPEADGPGLSSTLEAELFEQGGIHPPALALLFESVGLDSAHGQLMTLDDLIALAHVQMDTAGLGAFWPVVEHGLIQPDADQDFELPAGLKASWPAGLQAVRIGFISYDDFSGSLEDYALWTRAYRSLCALLDVHGVRSETESTLTLDPERHCLVESRGPVESADGLTEQVHADCGLLCWTLVEDHRQYNLYPIDSEGFALLQSDFQQRGLRARRPERGIRLDASGERLGAM